MLLFRFLLESAVSPYTGALNMPAAQSGSFGAGLGADTPCSEWSSGASTASIASHMRTCSHTGGIDMHDTPACKTVPGQQPITATLDTAGKTVPMIQDHFTPQGHGMETLSSWTYLHPRQHPASSQSLALLV